MSSSQQEPSNQEKWTISLISALVFLIIASPFMYQLTNAVFSPLGLRLSDKSGCPTVEGLLVHTVVFGLIVRLMMR